MCKIIELDNLILHYTELQNTVQAELSNYITLHHINGIKYVNGIVLTKCNGIPLT